MTEPPPSPGPRRARRGHRLRRPGVLAAALLLVAIAALARVSGGTGSAPTAHPASPPVSASAPPEIQGPVPPDVDPALLRGSNDAPVTLVVFGDFQCPYCATFSADQQPRLVRDYVAPGDLRLVWRDYPYLGEASVRAAVAARAAGRQDAFWDYHDALYADPGAWTARGAPGEGFTRIAVDLGLDGEWFQRDMDDPGLRRAVEDDMDFGAALGVPGTPAFLINGQAFFGAQPIDAFRERIEAARDEAK